MNYWAIFLTGLTTGGLTCLAMQGGLLSSVIANQKNEVDKKYANIKEDFLPVFMFLNAKLISHTILGFFLGTLGSFISLSLELRLVFQVLAAVFMFATAMNLLQVHPIFRFVAFQPPRFIQRFIRKQSKSDTLFAPALLGFLTIFIPCGVTQAMEVTAISTGSGIAGALTMFAFVLGTTPLFSLVGILTAKLSDLWNARFNLIAALALLFMSVYSVNGVLTVLNSPLTFSNLAQNIEMAITPPSIYAQKHAAKVKNGALATYQDGVQKVSININNSGYSPRYITVRQNVPVELQLQTNDTYSCATEFVLKKFNIAQRLAPTDTKTVTFTPTETGKFTYSCAMGMYEGVLEVVKDV